MEGPLLLTEWPEALPKVFAESDQNIRIRKRLVSADAVLEILELVIRIDRRNSCDVTGGEADMAFEAGSFCCGDACIQGVAELT